jgi:hypothetical protein
MIGLVEEDSALEAVSSFVFIMTDFDPATVAHSSMFARVRGADEAKGDCNGCSAEN